MAQEELARLGRRAWPSSQQDLRLQLLPKDAADEKSAILEVRAGTGGDEAALFAADLFRMYSRYAERARLEDRDHQHLGERPRRLQGDRRLHLRQGRVRPPQVRIGRAPRAARSGHRGERAHPHLRRHRCRAAGGRGDRPRHQARGHPHRHHAGRRCRRPARQQDGLGRAHHPPADRHHRRLGREIAAPEPPPRHAGAALAPLRAGARRRQPTARAPPSARARSARGDRSQRIRTYNFPQGRVTDHRIGLTLHKLDEVLRGHGARRADRRADHRAPGRASWPPWSKMQVPDAASGVIADGAAARWRRAQRARCERAGIEDAGNDARRLLAAVLGLSGAQLLGSARAAAQRRAGRHVRALHCPARAAASRSRASWASASSTAAPSAVSPATLDPRPDSETLIEVALELRRRRQGCAPRRCAFSTSAPAAVACC